MVGTYWREQFYKQAALDNDVDAADLLSTIAGAAVGAPVGGYIGAELGRNFDILSDNRVNSIRNSQAIGSILGGVAGSGLGYGIRSLLGDSTDDTDVDDVLAQSALIESLSRRGTTPVDIERLLRSTGIQMPARRHQGLYDAIQKASSADIDIILGSLLS